MSNTLMTMGQGPLTMSSREIAEMTGRRHDNVMPICRSLRDLGVCPEIQETPYTNEQNGQEYLECRLGKRDSLVLIARISPEFTAAVVDRWQELEAGQAPKLPQTLAQALRFAAEQAEEIERLAIERDTAVRTKAEIGSRREATAMATASAKSKEVAKLQHELGRNQQHATVIAVEKATKQKFAKNAYVGLRKAAKEFGLGAVDVVDQRYGSVKAWPAAAWRKCFGIDLGDLFPGEVA